ncbi:NUDIX domain-containing protein [bacterium]|nr:NUDIX domain-containing protein [bacterium]
MRIRRVVRAVLLTSEELVLLLKIEEPVSGRQFWITPGGEVEQGEDAKACMRRELEEETGLEDAKVGPLMWTRRHVFEWNNQKIDQQEEYYLVETDLFEPTMEGNPALGEKSAFRGFRWWSVEDIKCSSELFAPRRIGELLEALIRKGAPEEPFDVGI